MKMIDYTQPEQIYSVCGDTPVYAFPYGGFNCLIQDKDNGDFVVGMYYHKVENHIEELPEIFHEDFIKSLVYIGC